MQPTKMIDVLDPENLVGEELIEYYKSIGDDGAIRYLKQEHKKIDEELINHHNNH